MGSASSRLARATMTEFCKLFSVSRQIHLKSKTMPEEASDFAQANVRRFKLDVNKDAEQTLKKVLERRNNEEVVQHLEAAGNKPENYQYAVLQLTCNNDHNTLKSVLEYGEEIGGLGP